nr:hypothetical protein OH826_36180 [Streptomyces sp. NBC_00899]
MMRTFVPHGAAAALPAGWGVRRAARLAFPGPAALAADPAHTERLRVYLADLLQPYGLALDEAALARGGQSYGEMAEALIAQAVPPGESVDLLVLAYCVPDITPGRATTTWLSHLCPGTPMALAVSDQGPAAAFTALRLIQAYAAGAGLLRALLLVVEQDALPYDPGVPVALPTGSHGVALLLGPPAPGERTATIGALATSAAPGRPGAEALAGAGGAHVPVTAIVGPALPPPPGAHRVRTADAGRPTTGVWWELAAELAAPPPGPHRLVLADQATDRGTVSLAAFDVAAAVRHAATAGRRP